MNFRLRAAVLLVLIGLILTTVFGLGSGKSNAGQSEINLGNMWTSGTGNGVTDDTPIFREAFQMAQGGTLYVPKPTVAYSIHNLIIPANIHIIFEAGTIIQANANLPINKPLFKISHAANVTIDGNGAVFGMLNSQYPDRFIGEGTHVFSIIHSSNVVLNNITVTSSGGGDGFYINDVVNIRISECSASNCLRNGLSLIGAIGAVIENSVFFQNRGNGMCIEPNSPADTLQDIVFQNCLSENNGAYGLALGLDKYKTETSRTNVDVTFNDITTKNNGSTGLLLSVYNFTHGIDGTIHVNNYTSDGDRLAINVSNSGVTSPVITMNGWRILNPTEYHISRVNYQEAAWVRDQSGIMLGRVVFNPL